MELLTYSTVELPLVKGNSWRFSCLSGVTHPRTWLTTMIACYFTLTERICQDLRCIILARPGYRLHSKNSKLWGGAAGHTSDTCCPDGRLEPVGTASRETS